MLKTYTTILIFACALAAVGLAAGGIVAVLHGIQEGDWGYLVVYFVVVFPGMGAVIMLKNIYDKLSKDLEKGASDG